MAEYYMMNKPSGCLTACRHPRHSTVMDCFPDELRDNLFHVGRLDKDTEGLLILTDDGKLCKWLLDPDSLVEKRYFFWALGDINQESCDAICSGIDIYGDGNSLTAPAHIEILKRCTISDIERNLSVWIDRYSLEHPHIRCFSGILTITEGKKHQVKRMLRHFGHRVIYLKRVSIGPINLDENLLPGEYRKLSQSELDSIGIQ